MTQREILQERRAYLVREVSRMFVLGHEVHQSLEYEADLEKLRQTECDLANVGKFSEFEPVDCHNNG